MLLRACLTLRGICRLLDVSVTSLSFSSSLSSCSLALVLIIKFWRTGAHIFFELLKEAPHWFVSGLVRQVKAVVG